MSFAVEPDKKVSPLMEQFKTCDADQDGTLTEAEYLTRAGGAENVRRREFKVFDGDGDGKLTLAEFEAVPVGQSEEFRGAIADPVVQLSNARLIELLDAWKGLDKDGDDRLSAVEFKEANVPSRIGGMESTKFPDWDRDKDGQLSKDEVGRVIEIAFGVRTMGGELLRTPAGRVVDWRLFYVLKKDANGIVKVEDYVPALGPLDEQAKQNWVNSCDQNRDGKFDYAEFARGDHRTDPAATFLHLDQDLNGKLTPAELETLSADQLPIAAKLFPGFDDDGDGGLSLREYQLTPLVNLLTNWGQAKDSNDDGFLQPDEFRFQPDFAFVALGAEYFRRLDVDKSKTLSLDEFPFSTNRRPPNEISVRREDGTTVRLSIPDYPNIFSPEISPDGKWVAVDGWRYGQNNVAAHLLIASVETDEVRDLGIGCIPHWSADGKQISYSKYGRGVFIRDFDGDANEQKIDPQGWAIEFSPDGKQTAFVKGGNNFVIHDVQSGDMVSVFPDGQSPYRYIEHNFTWSPDSKRLCFKGHRQNGGMDVAIVQAKEGDPKHKVVCDGKDVSSDFSWSHEGQRLMFPRTPAGAAKTQLYEMNPDGDKPSVRFPTQPKDRNNINICWSRDGKTFVYLSTR